MDALAQFEAQLVAKAVEEVKRWLKAEKETGPQLRAKYGEFMTRREIADELSICTRTVRNMERDGRLPKAVRLGREGVIPTAAVEELVNQ